MIRADTGGMGDLAGLVRWRAEELQQAARSLRAAGRVVDADLQSGLERCLSVWAAALGVLAEDVDLIASRLAEGALTYVETDDAVAAAVGRAR